MAREAERTIVTPQMRDNLDRWRDALHQLGHDMCAGHERRVTSYDDFMAAMGSETANGDDTLMFFGRHALKLLDMSERTFPYKTLQRSAFGQLMTETLSTGLDPMGEVMAYYHAFKEGEVSASVAENVAPNFGKRLGMFGAERFLAVNLVHSGAIGEDIKAGLPDSTMTDPIGVRHIGDTLSEVRKQHNLYRAFRTGGLTPTHLEEIQGVTTHVVGRLLA